MDPALADERRVRTPIHGGADVDAFGSVALLGRIGEVEEITSATLGGFVTARA